MTDTQLKAQPPYIWLGSVWDAFTQNVVNLRMPHATLLIGQDGIGCFDLSVAMAQYLLCRSPSSRLNTTSGQSCGKCKSCLLLKAGTHPDIHLLSPEEKSRNIKIDQVRKLIEVMTNTSQQGGCKVVVIYPAESMNNNSANALLKSLEEPTGDCYFILVSEEPAFLPATVRSRCSRMFVPLPNREQALSWLERNNVTEAKLKLDEVRGRPIKVMQWIEQDLWQQQKSFRDSVSQLLLSGEGFIDCSKSQLSYGALWVVQQLMLSLGKAIPMSMGLEQQEQSHDHLAEAFKSQPTDRLLRFYDNLVQKKRTLLSASNPNAQLLCDEIMLQVQELAH